MNTVIECLIKLQEALSAMSDAERRQRELPVRLEALDRGLAEAARELEAARHEVGGGQKERRRLEMEVGTIEALISRHQGQILTVKSNEAYRTLQHEIDQERNKIRGLEDQILLLMERAEELAEQIKILEREHGAERARVERLKEGVRAEAETAALEIEKLAAARGACEAQIPPGMLEEFRRIAKGRGGVGLVRARNERCGACNVRLRPQAFQELLGGEKLLTCDSCSRYLYALPEPKPAGALKEEAQARAGGDAEGPAQGLEEGRAPAGS